jgi:hypothetical protein
MLHDQSPAIIGVIVGLSTGPIRLNLGPCIHLQKFVYLLISEQFFFDRQLIKRCCLFSKFIIVSVGLLSKRSFERCEKFDFEDPF